MTSSVTDPDFDFRTDAQRLLGHTEVYVHESLYYSSKYLLYISQKTIQKFGSPQRTMHKLTFAGLKILTETESKLSNSPTSIIYSSFSILYPYSSRSFE